MDWIKCVVLFGALLTVSFAQLETVVISHPGFNFETYPNLASVNIVQSQPYKFQTSASLYYSHVFGSLTSTVKGNITEIRYLSSNDKQFSFQIWSKDNNGNVNLKSSSDELTTSPVSGDDISLLTLPTPLAVDVGDMVGVWVKIEYPFATVGLDNQTVADYLITFGGWGSRKRPEQAQENDIKVARSTTNKQLYPNSPAYMPAVQVTIKYFADEQPPTTTPTTTTTISTTTTASTTTNTTTTETNSTTVSTTTTQSTTTKHATPAEKISTTIAIETTTTSVGTKFGQSSTVNPDDEISRELMAIVIAVPIVVLLIILILVGAMLCVRKRRNRKLVELKQSYIASGGGSSPDTNSDEVHDFEITDAYHYAPPLSNTNYQPSSLTSNASNQKSHKAMDEEVTVTSPVDDSLKPPAIMMENDLYETTNELTA